MPMEVEVKDKNNPPGCRNENQIPEIAFDEEVEDVDVGDEEYGTEVIPRCLPTPMEKKKPHDDSQNTTLLASTYQKQDWCTQRLSQGEGTSTFSANDSRSAQILHKNDDMALAESRQFLHPTFEAMVSASNNTTKVTEATRRNANIEQGQQYQRTEDANYHNDTEKTLNGDRNDTKETTSSCHEHTIKSTTLVERISSVLHHLSRMGLIIQKQNVNNVREKHESPIEQFLSLLYYMLEEASKEENHDGESRNYPPCMKQRMKLTGLLYVLEQILEQLKTIEEDCENWKDRCIKIEQQYSVANLNSQLSGNRSTCPVNGPPELSNITQHHTIQSCQMISLLQQENDALRHQLMQVNPTSELMELQNQLTDKHMECQRLEEIIRSLEQEQNHLIHLYEGKDMTNNRFERDIVTLKAENETMANENNSLHSEVLKLKRCMNDYEKRLHLTEENGRASMVARNEVMAKWNSTLKERTRLESQVGQFHREISIVKQQLMFSNDEKNRLMKQIKIFENDEKKHSAELAALKSEKRQITIELDVVKQSLEKIQIENHQLGQDLKSSRMNNDLSSQKTFELQQLSAKIQYDAEAFRNMSAELEMERDAMKVVIEDERRKINKLKNALSEAEIRDITASEQIQKLVREKALFVTRLNEANARKERDARLGHCDVSTPLKPLFISNYGEQSVPCRSDKAIAPRSEGKQNEPIEIQSRENRSLKKLHGKSANASSSIEHHRNDKNLICNDLPNHIKSSIDSNGPADGVGDNGTAAASTESDVETSKSPMVIPRAEQSSLSIHNEEFSKNISEKSTSLLDYISKDSVSIKPNFV